MSVTRFRMRPGTTRRVAAALAAAWFFVAGVLLPTAHAGMFSFDLKDEKELGEKFNALIDLQGREPGPPAVPKPQHIPDGFAQMADDFHPAALPLRERGSFLANPPGSRKG